ncbi:MAG TPA: AMP-binding protein [Candidatus Binatia bacterium]|nr:AMP-binding protein [Candidatus Binatia bacterium]
MATQLRPGSASATTHFRQARDFLLEHRGSPDAAYRDFRWPDLSEFNWALDWFDVIARGNERPALWIVEEDGSESKLSFAEMSASSSRVAAWLQGLGVRRGDRTLLMLGNRVALWECVLALTKLGAVMIPATTLLTPDDVADRIERGQVAHVIAESAIASRLGGLGERLTRIAVGEPVSGWIPYADWLSNTGELSIDQPTRPDDLLLLYFTSGTTDKPKLVGHTHASYPVGHLSTMYWIGLQPGDIHVNISSPGWAKHAWSNLFAPWNAGATVLVYNSGRFSATHLLDTLVRCEATTFCAPPTVWRMLIQEDLSSWRLALRELVSAGEPLNPEVIERVQEAWGLTIRDGFGQTETTAQVGNPPGQRLKPGSMGRPLPGYAIELLDPVTDQAGVEGEICIDLSKRPAGLMTGYLDDPEKTASVMHDGFYHTGDVASRDADGYLTYVGRADDVFKSSDYRISPFELESILIEHEAVAEAGVVPSPEPVRGSVPKAYVMLAPGFEPTAETALSILRHARESLAPYKRVRRLQFGELPKTISGKIRRVELRAGEAEQRRSGHRADSEFWEEDFPGLKSGPGGRSPGATG